MARKTSKKGIHKVARPRSGPKKAPSGQDGPAPGTPRMKQQALPFEANKTGTVKALALRPPPAGGVPVYAQRLLDLTAAHSLATWAAAYLQDEVAGIQARNTFEAKVRDLGAFVAWMAKAHGVAVIEEWVPRDTHRYLKNLERTGKSASTVNRVFASIRRFARWAQEQPGGRLQPARLSDPRSQGARHRRTELQEAQRPRRPQAAPSSRPPGYGRAAEERQASQKSGDPGAASVYGPAGQRADRVAGKSMEREASY